MEKLFAGDKDSLSSSLGYKLGDIAKCVYVPDLGINPPNINIYRINGHLMCFLLQMSWQQVVEWHVRSIMMIMPSYSVVYLRSGYNEKIIHDVLSPELLAHCNGEIDFRLTEESWTFSNNNWDPYLYKGILALV